MVCLGGVLSGGFLGCVGDAASNSGGLFIDMRLNEKSVNSRATTLLIRLNVRK
jgi:hypothetical protein